MSRLLELARFTASEDGRIYRDGLEVAGSDNGYGYLKVRAGNFTFKLHKIAAERFYGGVALHCFPRVAEIVGSAQWDVAHKDHNKRNNSKANLAYVPHSFNQVHNSDCPLLRRLASADRERQKRRDRRTKRESDNKCGRSWCRPAAAILSFLGGRASRERAIRIGQIARPSARLTASQVNAIRAACAAGRSLRSIAIEVGVSATQVGRIVHGKHWGGLPCVTPT